MPRETSERDFERSSITGGGVDCSTALTSERWCRSTGTVVFTVGRDAMEAICTIESGLGGSGRLGGGIASGRGLPGIVGRRLPGDDNELIVDEGRESIVDGGRGLTMEDGREPTVEGGRVPIVPERGRDEGRSNDD